MSNVARNLSISVGAQPPALRIRRPGPDLLEDDSNIVRRYWKAARLCLQDDAVIRVAQLNPGSKDQ